MVHVICFGNLWQGADGFGVRVFQRLSDRSDWPAHIKIFEAGTAGLAALDYFEGCRKVVIVDALKTGGT
ncbi:MAG TPA: hydrogenase maturation protease, partial [Pseudolabrys sp.]